MGVLNCYHFSLCHGQHPYVCLNINNYFSLSVQCQQHCKPSWETRSELILVMLLKERSGESMGEVNQQDIIFSIPLPLDAVLTPKMDVFPGAH